MKTMTTLETLTLYQVHALQSEAEAAGDAATAADCVAVDAGYWKASASDLQGSIAESGCDQAARRIVAAINNAEAQQ